MNAMSSLKTDDCIAYFGLLAIVNCYFRT